MSTERVWCILLVDDDSLVLELVSARLSTKGYRVVLAADGEEAYRVMKAEKPDVIVCDIMMPKVDGVSFCRKARGEGYNTPFLFLTAKSQPQDVIEGLSSGADDYLVKPFDARELEARIATVLRRYNPPSPNP